MAYTYTDTPVNDGTAAQKRDAVRFLAQDNATGSMRVSDAEIAYLIATEANVYMAAAMAVDSIVMKLGQIKRKKVGDTEIERELAHFEALAKSLRRRGSAHQVPYVGGLSVSEKEIDKTNTDRVQPFFERDVESQREDTER